MTNNERDLRTFMAIAEDVAITKAKLMATTPEIARISEAAIAFGRERIAQMRREELARRPSNVVSGAIRETIRRMTRSEAIARLSQIWTVHPELQFAHRECDEMTDDDLRSALEDAESLIERTV